MGHCTVCLLYTHFQVGEFIDIHLVFSDKLLLRSYKRLTLSLLRVTLDFDYMKMSNARRFYSSKGDPLGVKGLRNAR